MLCKVIVESYLVEPVLLMTSVVYSAARVRRELAKLDDAPGAGECPAR
jgi:hypothetical protein